MLDDDTFRGRTHPANVDATEHLIDQPSRPREDKFRVCHIIGSSAVCEMERGTRAMADGQVEILFDSGIH